MKKTPRKTKPKSKGKDKDKIAKEIRNNLTKKDPDKFLQENTKFAGEMSTTVSAIVDTLTVQNQFSLSEDQNNIFKNISDKLQNIAVSEVDSTKDKLELRKLMASLVAKTEKDIVKLEKDIEKKDKEFKAKEEELKSKQEEFKKQLEETDDKKKLSDAEVKKKTLEIEKLQKQMDKIETQKKTLGTQKKGLEKGNAETTENVPEIAKKKMSLFSLLKGSTEKPTTVMGNIGEHLAGKAEKYLPKGLLNLKDSLQESAAVDSKKDFQRQVQAQRTKEEIASTLPGGAEKSSKRVTANRKKSAPAEIQDTIVGKARHPAGTKDAAGKNIGGRFVTGGPAAGPVAGPAAGGVKSAAGGVKSAATSGTSLLKGAAPAAEGAAAAAEGGGLLSGIGSAVSGLASGAVGATMATGAVAIGGLAAGLYAGDKMFNTSVAEGGSGNLSDTMGQLTGSTEKKAVANDASHADDVAQKHGFANMADMKAANRKKAMAGKVGNSETVPTSQMVHTATQAAAPEPAAPAAPAIINNAPVSAPASQGSNVVSPTAMRIQDNSFIRFQDKRIARV